MPVRTLHANGSVKSRDHKSLGSEVPISSVNSGVALLTGGSDRHYTFGLAMALISKGVSLDVIGSDAVDSYEMHVVGNLNFLNLRGDQRPEASLPRKVSRLLIYYARLIAYALNSKPKIFHVLWNNKFQFFDRTLLMLYYKSQGKKIVLTAHNVNEARRDRHDSLLNRLTLRVQYRLADHIFVHTEKMRKELIADYGVQRKETSVIPYGINNALPHTDLSYAEAKNRLGINGRQKVIMFFGYIRPSKGLEYLLAAFRRSMPTHLDYRLIIAGQPAKGSEDYWEGIQRIIQHMPIPGLVSLKSEYIPDHELEVYFKAADVLVLPYVEIFQSGVLFLGYSYGLPVIATDVGSFREDIIEGKTGFLCEACDDADLARAIEKYFESDLFKCLDRRRQEIRDYAETRHSWDTVGEITCNVYKKLCKGKLP